SEHIREVLADVVGHTDRVFDVPPGVDIDRFVLQGRGAALEDLLAEARKDPPNGGDVRLPDDGNAQRLAAFLDGLGPLVVYFGKLIEEKGVQVLLEAMRGIDARLVVVGFGPYRSTLESLAPSRTLFTGPLEHRHLRHLLPLADVTVVPSIFPEAFGMVAAEAAAAWFPPRRGPPSGGRRGRGGRGGRVPRGSPRSRRTWGPAIQPSRGTSRASRRANRRTWPESSAS